MADDSYLGVEARTLTALGRVVVAAGRIEWLVFALDFHSHGPAKGTLAPMIKRVRTSSNGSPAGLGEWLTNVKSAMDDRNKLFHSGFAQLDSGPVRIQINSRSVLHSNDGEIDALAERFASMFHEGWRYLVEVSDGDIGGVPISEDGVG